LVADARLVLEPDFNGLIFGMVGEPRATTVAAKFF
jgi:hypothetical protein